MTSDLDIYRSAPVLVKQQGHDAAIDAAMRADAMLDKGDLDGYAVRSGYCGRWRSYRGRRLGRARRFTDRPLPTWHRWGRPCEIPWLTIHDDLPRERSDEVETYASAGLVVDED